MGNNVAESPSDWNRGPDISDRVGQVYAARPTRAAQFFFFGETLGPPLTRIITIDLLRKNGWAVVAGKNLSIASWRRPDVLVDGKNDEEIGQVMYSPLKCNAAEMEYLV